MTFNINILREDNLKLKFVVVNLFLEGWGWAGVKRE